MVAASITVLGRVVGCVPNVRARLMSGGEQVRRKNGTLEFRQGTASCALEFDSVDAADGQADEIDRVLFDGLPCSMQFAQDATLYESNGRVTALPVGYRFDGDGARITIR